MPLQGQQQFVTPQPRPSKATDLNASMGPPSGMAPEGGESFKESFKNPWTTIPRPMNRFTEISAAQYERQEKEKQDL